MASPTRKPLYFIASSWKDLKGLPGPVQDTFDTLLLDVQYGETPASAKPLKGLNHIAERHHATLAHQEGGHA